MWISMESASTYPVRVLRLPILLFVISERLQHESRRDHAEAQERRQLGAVPMSEQSVARDL